MEWTPARIRLFRDVGLCQSQEGFATTLGFAKRTIGNAERGVHPPSLALRRALDQALDNTSDIQRDRFLAAAAADQGTATLIHSPVGREPFGSHTSQVSALHGLRCAVLDTPLPMGVNGSVTRSAASVTAATAQAHRLYHLAEYDAAAQLLPAVLTCLQNQVDTGSDECLAGTLTTRHATAAAYLATAKLATKLGDIVLASVAADRSMTAAQESEHPALSVQSRIGNAKKAAQIAGSIDTDVLPATLRGRRSQVHLEMAWAAAGQADDALAVLHLLETERVAEQAVSRNISARTLLGTLLARERRGDTPGLRGLAARAGLLS